MKLMCSSGTKEQLEKLVNEFYFTNYVVLKDSVFINTKLKNKIVGYYEFKKNRHRFLLDI